jgi:hypothetical protein
LSEKKPEDVEFEEEGSGGTPERKSAPPAPVAKAPDKKVDDLRQKLGLGTAKTLVAQPTGKTPGALPGVPGIPGLGGPPATGGVPGVPGVPGIPGLGGPAKPAPGAGRTLVGTPGAPMRGGVPGVPGIPGLPGMGGPAKGAIPGLPGMTPPAFATQAEPAKPEADKHDPFGQAGQSTTRAAGAIDVEKVVLDERQLKDLTTLKEGKRQMVFYAVIGVSALIGGAIVGWMLGGNESRDKVVQASIVHARKIQAGLEKAHVPKVKLFQEKLEGLKKRIADAMATRDPSVILTTISEDATDLEATQQTELSKAEDVIGEILVVGNLSAFANETIGPVLKAIALWNRFNEQILVHVQTTRAGLARYGFQIGALSAAGFDKETKCRAYLERHKADTGTADEKIAKTMASCTEFLTKFDAGKLDVSGLIGAALAAYTAGQDVSAGIQADVLAYFTSLRQKIGGQQAADAISSYLGPSRFAVAFDKDYWGQLSEGNWTGDMTRLARLFLLDDRIQVLETPVSWTDLGLEAPAAAAPAEGAEAPAEGAAEPPPPPEAKNLLGITIGGEGSGVKDQSRFLFVLDPGQSGGWNDINGDETFNNLDVELFWQSFRAKPELWALVVEPSPAIGLIDAYNALFVQQYQERLIALYDTANAIASAITEARKKIGAIR